MVLMTKMKVVMKQNVNVMLELFIKGVQQSVTVSTVVRLQGGAE